MHEADDLIRKLDGVVDDLLKKREAAEQRADEAERTLAKALVEIERLKASIPKP